MSIPPRLSSRGTKSTKVLSTHQGQGQIAGALPLQVRYSLWLRDKGLFCLSFSAANGRPLMILASITVIKNELEATFSLCNFSSFADKLIYSGANVSDTSWPPCLCSWKAGLGGQGLKSRCIGVSRLVEGDD